MGFKAMRKILSTIWVLVLAVTASVGAVGHAVGQTWHGLSYETLTFEKAEAAGLVVFEGAIITKVAPKSPAAGSLQLGDVINYSLGAKRKRIVNSARSDRCFEGGCGGQQDYTGARAQGCCYGKGHPQPPAAEQSIQCPNGRGVVDHADTHA